MYTCDACKNKSEVLYSTHDLKTLQTIKSLCKNCDDQNADPERVEYLYNALGRYAKLHNLKHLSITTLYNMTFQEAIIENADTGEQILKCTINEMHQLKRRMSA